MITFYRARFPGQAPDSAAVLAEDEQAGLLLRWVPNTGLWHRAVELENDYLFGDGDGAYTEISAEEAAGLLSAVPRLDKRQALAARMLTELKGQPAHEKRTNAELGLSNKDTGLAPDDRPRPAASAASGPITPVLAHREPLQAEHRQRRTPIRGHLAPQAPGPGRTGLGAAHHHPRPGHRRASPARQQTAVRDTGVSRPVVYSCCRGCGRSAPDDSGADLREAVTCSQGVLVHHLTSWALSR